MVLNLTIEAGLAMLYCASPSLPITKRTSLYGEAMASKVAMLLSLESRLLPISKSFEASNTLSPAFPSQRYKMLFLILDAPPHGKRFGTPYDCPCNIDEKSFTIYG